MAAFLLCQKQLVLLINVAVFITLVSLVSYPARIAMGLLKTLTFDGHSHGQRYRHGFSSKFTPCGYQTLGNIKGELLNSLALLQSIRRLGMPGSSVPPGCGRLGGPSDLGASLKDPFCPDYPLWKAGFSFGLPNIRCLSLLVYWSSGWRWTAATPRTAA